MTSFERLFALMIKPWLIMVSMALIIVTYLYVDKPTAFYLRELDLRTHLPFLNLFTKLGLGGIYLIGLFLLALFFRYYRPNRKCEEQAWFLWLSAVLPSITCLIFKVFLGRARPDLLFGPDHLFGFYWFKLKAPYWSFPSGHTTTVMGFVFGLSVLFPRYWYAFIFSGLLLTSTRVLLTHHYVSDLLMASYIALLEVGFLTWWLRREKWLVNAL